MSEPRITLQHVLEVIRQRPTTPDTELAVIEFLELSDSEQKVLLFRELGHVSACIDWLMAQAQK